MDNTPRTKLHPAPRTASRRNAGLSLIEMLIAFTISATLLTATLAALDTMFKGYKQTTESASTHVISRIVMSRALAMIRTGSDFEPRPASVLDANANPLAADFIQFDGRLDENGVPLEKIRLDFRYPGAQPRLRSWGVAAGPPAPAQGEEQPTGPGELWYCRLNPDTDAVLEQHPLLSGVAACTFTMEYDIGPKLTRATIDITIEPNDSRDLTVGADSVAQTIRLVASAAPRTSTSD